MKEKLKKTLKATFVLLILLIVIISIIEINNINIPEPKIDDINIYYNIKCNELYGKIYCKELDVKTKKYIVNNYIDPEEILK